MCVIFTEIRKACKKTAAANIHCMLSTFTASLMGAGMIIMSFLQVKKAKVHLSSLLSP